MTARVHLRSEGTLLLTTSTAAFVVAVLVSMILIAGTGASPTAALSALWDGAFGNTRRIADTFEKTLPLTLTALGWVVAFSARRINIGLEGQILAGGIVSAIIGLNLSMLPLAVHLPLAVIGGMAGGAAYAGIAAWLWSRRHVNDIISTLLLNFVALQAVAWLVRGPLEEPTGTLAQTERVHPSSQWPALVARTSLDWDMVMAAALTVLTAIALRRTTFGFRLRLTGANEQAARHAGVNTKRVGVLALVISGGFAGLAGSSLIVGSDAANMADNFSAGFGFDGIVVALLARNRPLATLPAAFMFGALRQGSGLMEARVGVSSALVDVTQAIVILLVAAGAFVLERRRSIRVEQNERTEVERERIYEVETT